MATFRVVASPGSQVTCWLGSGTSAAGISQMYTFKFSNQVTETVGSITGRSAPSSSPSQEIKLICRTDVAGPGVKPRAYVIDLVIWTTQ